MIIFWTRSTRVDQSREIMINCPSCKRDGVASVACDKTFTTKLYMLLPIYVARRHSVICGGCKQEFDVKLPAAEIAGLTPTGLLPHLVPPATTSSAVYKLATIVGLVTCFLPFIPLILSTVGLIGTHRAGGVWRVLGAIAVVASFFFTCLWLVFILMPSAHP